MKQKTAFILSSTQSISSASQGPVQCCRANISQTSFISTRVRRVRTHAPQTKLKHEYPKCSFQPVPAPAQRSILTILSTIVGVCVLIGSLLYKIPQLVRVVRRRSAAGISILMYALETIGTTFSAVYFARKAFPFASYGESVFIMAQNVLLMGFIALYQRLPRIPAAIAFVLYAISLLLLYSKLVPLKVLVVLQVCSIPILNLARVPQIALNWRRKGTGELSPITLGLQLLGNVARIFTTIAQVKDPLMFAGICVATCFNTTLFAQWIYYSRRFPKVAEQLPGR